MKKTIIAELEKSRKQKKIDDWKITYIDLRRANQYITKNFETESFLEAERKEVHIEVYKKFGKQIGDSSFVISENDARLIAKQIKLAATLCKYSKKPRYSPVAFSKTGKKVALTDLKIKQGFDNGKIHLEMQKLCDSVHKEVKKYRGVKLNGFELHVSHGKRELLNSRNVRQTQEKTNVYVEMVLTSFDKKKEMEFLPMHTFSRLSDFKVAQIIKKDVQAAKDVLASKGSISFSGPVLLSGGALKEYFVPELSVGPLRTHASGRIKYMGLSRYSIGDVIASDFKGDKVTVYNNPLLTYNPLSSNFDEDGVASRKLLIIDKGVFKNYFANKQYADYLNIKPTGPIGAIELGCGKNTENKLRKKTSYVEIVAFASFSPNDLSGDFSAEIRLGYLWKNGKKTPFRGGMFTGNVFKMIEDVHFSKEKTTVTGYTGPKVVVFNKGIIAGI